MDHQKSTLRDGDVWAWVILGGGVAVTVCVFLLVPPVTQDPRYHNFADQRTLLHVHNWWNVVSNLAFLIAAVFGGRALRSEAAWTERWERSAFHVLLAATALVACGSAYYHYSPDSDSLVWDRLPMTMVFMSLFANTVGERISMGAGRRALLPLLAIGVSSVIYWRVSGDLRWYGVVQFYPMIAITVLLLLRPARYTGSAGIFGMIALYGLAKLFELYDHPFVALSPVGGHPWKHVLGAAALLCYFATVSRRKSTPGPLAKSLISR